MPGDLSLQEAAFFVAHGLRHHAYAASPLLSIKCMFNGRALYRASRACFAVDETGYLILNDQQSYEIEINSRTRVESFIVFFPRGWSQEVLRALTKPEDRLLDDPNNTSAASPHFFEHFTPHDDFVSPALRKLRAAHKNGPLSNLWIEQQLRDLLSRMLAAQQQAGRQIDRIPFCRASTRVELWRRLNRAHDFIRAHSTRPLTLQEIASVACLSPFHCLRAFKTIFHTTPHAYLSECRLEHARFLLERTDVSVTEVCFDVGFESPGTFSSWFYREHGMSPRAWRSRCQKSNSEEVFRTAMV